MQLNLSTDDARLLRDVLMEYVSDLRMEIANTDGQEFRDRLKAKESMLNALIAALTHP